MQKRSVQFSNILKYQCEVSIPVIGIETRDRKVSILQNGYHCYVSKTEVGIETRYRKVLIPEKGIDTQH